MGTEYVFVSSGKKVKIRPTKIGSLVHAILAEAVKKKPPKVKGHPLKLGMNPPEWRKKLLQVGTGASLSGKQKVDLQHVLRARAGQLTSSKKELVQDIETTLGVSLSKAKAILLGLGVVGVVLGRRPDDELDHNNLTGLVRIKLPNPAVPPTEGYDPTPLTAGKKVAPKVVGHDPALGMHPKTWNSTIIATANKSKLNGKQKVNLKHILKDKAGKPSVSKKDLEAEVSSRLGISDVVAKFVVADLVVAEILLPDGQDGYRIVLPDKSKPEGLKPIPHAVPTKPEEPKPEEPKPAAPEPVELKPTEQKPEEPKPADPGGKSVYADEAFSKFKAKVRNIAVTTGLWKLAVEEAGWGSEELIKRLLQVLEPIVQYPQWPENDLAKQIAMWLFGVDTTKYREQVVVYLDYLAKVGVLDRKLGKYSAGPHITNPIKGKLASLGNPKPKDIKLKETPTTDPNASASSVDFTPKSNTPKTPEALNAVLSKFAKQFTLGPVLTQDFKDMLGTYGVSGKVSTIQTIGAAIASKFYFSQSDSLDAVSFLAEHGVIVISDTADPKTADYDPDYETYGLVPKEAFADVTPEPKQKEEPAAAPEVVPTEKGTVKNLKKVVDSFLDKHGLPTEYYYYLVDLFQDNDEIPFMELFDYMMEELAVDSTDISEFLGDLTSKNIIHLDTINKKIIVTLDKGAALSAPSAGVKAEPPEATAPVPTGVAKPKVAVPPQGDDFKDAIYTIASQMFMTSKQALALMSFLTAYSSTGMILSKGDIKSTLIGSGLDFDADKMFSPGDFEKTMDALVHKGVMSTNGYDYIIHGAVDDPVPFSDAPWFKTTETAVKPEFKDQQKLKGPPGLSNSGYMPKEEWLERVKKTASLIGLDGKQKTALHELLKDIGDSGFSKEQFVKVSSLTVNTSLGDYILLDLVAKGVAVLAPDGKYYLYQPLSPQQASVKGIVFTDVPPPVATTPAEPEVPLATSTPVAPIPPKQKVPSAVSKPVDVSPPELTPLVSIEPKVSVPEAKEALGSAYEGVIPAVSSEEGKKALDYLLGTGDFPEKEFKNLSPAKKEEVVALTKAMAVKPSNTGSDLGNKMLEFAYASNPGDNYAAERMLVELKNRKNSFLPRVEKALGETIGTDPAAIGKTEVVSAGVYAKRKGVSVEPFTPEVGSGLEDLGPSVVLKVPKSSGAEKMKELLKDLGIDSTGFKEIAGSYNNMIFVPKAQWEAAAIEVEVDTTPQYGAIQTKRQKYQPEIAIHEIAAPNVEALDDIEKEKVLPPTGKRVTLDGPAVEGQQLAVKRVQFYGEESPTYFVQFKLRAGYSPSVPKGTPKKLFNMGTGSVEKDNVVVIKGVADYAKDGGIDCYHYTSDNSELYFAKQGDFSFKNGVYALVRPMENESFKQAFGKLLKKLGGGKLVEAMFRNPDPVEQEVLRLGQLYRDAAPYSEYSKLKDSDMTVGKLTSLLASKGITSEQINQLVTVEYEPGFATTMLPGRWREQRNPDGTPKVRFILFGNSRPEHCAQILSGQGILGIDLRLMTGKGFFGSSAGSDVKSGAADNPCFRLYTTGAGSYDITSTYAAGSYQFIIAPDELDRVDAYFAHGDSFGCCNPKDTHSDYLSWKKPIQQSIKIQDDNFHGSGEVMFRKGVALRKILCVATRSESSKELLMNELAKLKIETINGIPASDFIVLANRSDEIYNKVVAPAGY